MSSATIYDTMSVTPNEPRKRRAPGEVDGLIIDAARELFAAKGYAAATTREIAELAKVHEPMVYRRFGSKAKLFEATVLAPFNELTAQHLQSFQPASDPDASLEDLARSFVEPFYDLLRQRRDLVLALFAAAQFHTDFSGDGSLGLTGFSQMVEQLEAQLEIEAASRPMPGVDTSAALILSMAMVIGSAILGDWLQPPTEHVSGDRLVDEIVKLSAHGMTRASNDGPRDAGAATSLDVRNIRRLLDRVADAERRATRAELELELLPGRATGDATLDTVGNEPER
jgi:AcrR family transcriptional regulator